MPTLADIAEFNGSEIDDFGALVSWNEARHFKSHGIVWHAFWFEVKEPNDEITARWCIYPNENYARESDYPIEFAYREVFALLCEWGAGYDVDGDLSEVLKWLCDPRVKEEMKDNEYFPKFSWA
jgi:hypothetical protein